jgi:hypothetical protein
MPHVLARNCYDSSATESMNSSYDLTVHKLGLRSSIQYAPNIIIVTQTGTTQQYSLRFQHYNRNTNGSTERFRIIQLQRPVTTCVYKPEAANTV